MSSLATFENQSLFPSIFHNSAQINQIGLEFEIFLGYIHVARCTLVRKSLTINRLCKNSYASTTAIACFSIFKKRLRFLKIYQRNRFSHASKTRCNIFTTMHFHTRLSAWNFFFFFANFRFCKKKKNKKKKTNTNLITP